IDDGDWHDQAYTTVLECPNCLLPLPELEPRLFHFNDPHGACPRCTGYGQIPATESARPIPSPDAPPETKEEQDDEDDGTDSIPCPECGGARLNAAARAVTFAGKGLHEVTALAVDEACAFFEALDKADESVQGLEKVRQTLM